MVDMIPFAFEETLVRAVKRSDEPWFVGKDICLCLGIKNTNDALSSLDEDEKGVATTDPLGPGGEQTVVVISEPGVYRLVFRSRKPEAERFKRWLAHDVLPELRRTGRFEPDAPTLPETDPRREPLMHRLQVVREARALGGRQAALVLWQRLGLPPLPPPPPTALGEARQCLRHLLDAPVYEGGPLIRDTLEAALDDSVEHQALLVAAGVRALPESDSFVVANDHPWLRRVFRGTDWERPVGCWMRVLRRLPNVEAGRQFRYGDGVQRRGTVLSADLLDDGG